MARLPTGQHWISGANKGLGSTGTHGHLSRQATENLGARELGYRSAYEYNRQPANARSIAQSLGNPSNKSAGAMNYRADLQRAKEASALRGEKFDRAAFDSNVARMREAAGPGGRNRSSDEFREALGQYMYDTGRQDTPASGH